MVTDEDVLEKDDIHILNRMKAFVASEEVSRFGAAKPLSAQIERAVCPFHHHVCYVTYILFRSNGEVIQQSRQSPIRDPHHHRSCREQTED
jgi:hypothetical protein